MIISEYPLSTLVNVAINLYDKSEDLSSLVRTVRVLNNMDNAFRKKTSFNRREP